MSKTSKIRKLKTQLAHQKRLLAAKDEVIGSAKQEIYHLQNENDIVLEQWRFVVDTLSHTLGRDHVIQHILGYDIRAVPDRGDHMMMRSAPALAPHSFLSSKGQSKMMLQEVTCDRYDKLIVEYLQRDGGKMLRVDIGGTVAECYVQPELFQATDKSHAINVLAKEFVEVLQKGVKR
jgi:hypothetical protein